MKLLSYTRAEFLRGLRYRAGYWARLASSLILTLIQWSLWRAVYQNADSIAGVSASAMMAYILMGRVTSGFLDQPSNLNIGARVRSGSIVHDMVKPVDLHAQLLFQSLGGALFRLASTGLPLFLLLVATGLVKSPDTATTLVFVLSLILGYLTVFSIAFASGVLTFYTQHGVGVEHLYSLVEFLSGAYLPLALFPGWLGKVANALPFKAIHYIPMAIWSGIATPAEVYSAMVTQVAWTGAMVLLCRAIWAGAVRRLTVQGG